MKIHFKHDYMALNLTLEELKERIDELVGKRKDLSRKIKILRNRYFARKCKKVK